MTPDTDFYVAYVFANSAAGAFLRSCTLTERGKHMEADIWHTQAMADLDSLVRHLGLKLVEITDIEGGR